MAAFFIPMNSNDPPAFRHSPPFDPEQVPLDPSFDEIDTRGRAVAAASLTSSAIKSRFAAPPVWQPEIVADLRIPMANAEPRPASVLIALVQHGDELRVLLTQRTAHLHDHAGQISFPGGRVEASDSGPVATALRETHEEIGIAPASVDVIGMLPDYVTATGYRVTPVVGLIAQPVALVLDSFEVAEAFEVPLAFLMDPAHHERHLYVMGEVARRFYAMPYTAERRYFIWGATAAMLRNFYHFMRA